MPFIKAAPDNAKIHIALIGPTGSGKTYSALRLARGLAGPDGKIAFLDSEKGRAKVYSKRFAFDHQNIVTANPREYIDAIHEAEDAGYDVLIIDSLSHAWVGKQGALALVDEGSKRSGGNKFAAWSDVTPLQSQLVEAITSERMHVICTMRAKMEYVLEPGANGKMAPRKVGLGPVQRDGIEYEFDVAAMIDGDHNFIVIKTVFESLDGKLIPKADEKLGAAMLKFLVEERKSDVASLEKSKREDTEAADRAATGNAGAAGTKLARDAKSKPTNGEAKPAPSDTATADGDKPWQKWQQIQMSKFSEKLGFASDDARHEFIMSALKVPDGFTWEQVKAGMTMEQAQVVINAMRAAINAKQPATK